MQAVALLLAVPGISRFSKQAHQLYTEEAGVIPLYCLESGYIVQPGHANLTVAATMQ